MEHTTQNTQHRTRSSSGIPCYVLRVTSVALFAFLPFLTHAMTAVQLLNNISKFIINPIIYVLFSAAFVVFILGLVQFIGNSGNEEGRATGGKHILWGIIGMVIMVAVNGILAVICNTIINIGGGTSFC